MPIIQTATTPGATRTGPGRDYAAVVIQSTYHEFGAAVVAGDTGVLLQNRGSSFSLDPTHPNCLAPRKRPAHTLTPSMYLIGGHPRFVYGTMGGDRQPQTQAALLTRMVVHGLSPKAAVDAPRWLYGRTWANAPRDSGWKLASALTSPPPCGPEVTMSVSWRTGAISWATLR